VAVALGLTRFDSGLKDVFRGAVANPDDLVGFSDLSTEVIAEVGVRDVDVVVKDTVKVAEWTLRVNDG
jgi:hypothetical protein